VAFAVIPVLDLMEGRVVRAVAGERARYRPLRPGDSVLTEHGEPHEVVRAFLRLHPFRILYLADLDAILGRGDQTALVSDLERTFPDVEFWCDAGVRDEADLRRRLARRRGPVVVGSETLADAAWLGRWREDPRLVLSLDHRGGTRLGPAALFAEPDLWPARVVVMTLAAVGTGGGPEVARIREIRARAGGRAVYAAGGVRDRADLLTLRALGCAGVLVASCLHRGTVTAADLAAVA